MLEKIPGTKPVTVAGDKAYDTADFVAECRNLKVTPHVAQNLERPGGSSIDARTTQHAGYAISQRTRKRIEECCGWRKTIALLRKVRHRGIFKVGWGSSPSRPRPTTWSACGIWRLSRGRSVFAGPRDRPCRHQGMRSKLFPEFL